MEKQRFSRLVGVIYVIGAVFGLIISVGGMIVLWTTRDEVTASIDNTMHLVGRTLDSTSEMVVVVEASLDKASTELGIVQTLLINSSETLMDSGELITSTSDLISGRMVDFVGNTQSSMRSVQNSARMVDNVLNTINSIPLLGPWLGRGYEPDVPLQASVQLVNESLDPLPDSFRQISRDLDVASANVSVLQAEVETLAAQIDDIQSSVSDAQQVVGDYRIILGETHDRYDRFTQRLPVLLDTLYIGITGILAWVLITQIGMLAHGIDLLH